MPAKSDHEPTDQQLVERLNRGDEAAFETLYLKYRDWVLRLAWRFTGHHDDAQDVLQETFAYVVRKCPGFQLTASMTTFLYPAVRNLSIAARRRRKRHVGGDDCLELFESPHGEPGQAPELAPLLNTLSETHREILLMRFVDDLSQPEIAAALEIPLGTVKSRLHHAIDAVRQLPHVVALLSNAD